MERDRTLLDARDLEQILDEREQLVRASPIAVRCCDVVGPKSPSATISSVARTEVSGDLRSWTIIFIRSSRTFSSSRSLR
jgi:hypothetical protein